MSRPSGSRKQPFPRFGKLCSGSPAHSESQDERTLKRGGCSLHQKRPAAALPVDRSKKNDFSLSKKSLYAKQDAMKGCKPFIFDRIDRLCRSGGAIFWSKAQKNHFRSLAMQDEFLHPAWSVSKTSFFDTLKE